LLQNHAIALSGNSFQLFRSSTGRGVLINRNFNTAPSLTRDKPSDISCSFVVIVIVVVVVVVVVVERKSSDELEIRPTVLIWPITIAQVPQFCRIGSAYQHVVIQVEKSLSVV
jgi:hypothetical protein